MTPHDPILSWLVAALTSWTSPPMDASVAQARAEVAGEIAEVAYDPFEPPVYGGTQARAKTAVLLGVIATLETRLAGHVRAGRCRPHECDHGAAVGLMQIHVGPDGIRLTELGYASCLHESDILRDERTAIRLALHMIRQSGLASYCGEAPEGPVTERRRSEVKAWLAKSPVPVADGPYMADSD